MRHGKKHEKLKIVNEVSIPLEYNFASAEWCKFFDNIRYLFLEVKYEIISKKSE